MRISKEKLFAEAQTSGFRPEVLEKVIHLLNLLEGFQRHPFLKGRLALKGGTALNLFLFDLPRLSVDIDINYIGAVDRATMLEERPKVEQAMRAVCSREGINTVRTPGDHAGGKWQLRYDSSLGQHGNLEVDLNFMFRVPLWPIEIRDSRQIGSYSAKKVPVLDLHELAAGKLAALLARHAGRDLFDAHRLLTTSDLNPEKLRLGFVLYGAMNRKDWRTVSVDDVAYDAVELRNQLVPVVRGEFLAGQDTGRWVETMIDECRQGLSMVLPMRQIEIEFLDGILDRGQIAPELLTADADMIHRIQAHPLLQWKALNVRKHIGR
jgi:predicted nucleotidyltransferase component of viral defense system